METNLYGSGRIVVMNDDPMDQELMLLRRSVAVQARPDDKFVIARPGEDLDLIADREYVKYVDDPCKLWWALALRNDVYNPLDLEEFQGKTLVVPSLGSVLI